MNKEYNDLKKSFDERKQQAANFYAIAKRYAVEYLEDLLNDFLKEYGDRIVLEFCPVSDNAIDEKEISCVAVRSGYDKECVYIQGTTLSIDTNRNDKYYVSRANELLNLLTERLNKENKSYYEKKSLIYKINRIIGKVNAQREIALQSIVKIDKCFNSQLRKAVYVGLENVLVYISALNNSGAPKPAMSYTDADNSIRYVYVRPDIRTLAGVDFGVVSELNQKELMQVVEFLNTKYGLNIVDEFASNGINFPPSATIVYADCIRNVNYNERIKNFAGCEFVEAKIFSENTGTSKGSGLSMRRLKKYIRRQSVGFSNEN